MKDLGLLEQAARQEQVTVNDVVLALTGGALRRYLGQRGELTGRSLTADRVEDPWQLAGALRAEEAEFTWRYAKRPRRGRRTAPTRAQARRTGADGSRAALQEA